MSEKAPTVRFSVDLNLDTGQYRADIVNLTNPGAGVPLQPLLKVANAALNDVHSSALGGAQTTLKPTNDEPSITADGKLDE